MRTERRFLWKCLQVVARVLTTLLFDLKVYGRRHVPARGGVLIVSNHQSALDPVVLAVRLSRPMNYLAKSELFQYRCFTRLLRVVNAFPVRQGAGDVRAVKETIQRLQEGHLMNVYPEGARTLDGEIGPMQKGVALIIERARVAVVPAVIVGAFEAWPIQRRVFTCRPIRIQYGPPMDLTGLERDEIMIVIDRKLREMHESLRAGSCSGA